MPGITKSPNPSCRQAGKTKPASTKSAKESPTIKVETPRQTKQDRVRAQGAASFERVTCITPYGFRSVRLHPSTDTSAQMAKYRPRPSTAIGLMHSHVKSKDIVKNSVAASLSSMSLKERPSSSRSVVFNTRNPSCTPRDMYMEDEVRALARGSCRGSSPCSTTTSSSTSGASSCTSDFTSSTYPELAGPRSDVAYRFGKPVQRPRFVQKNKFLNHVDLSMGQKQYIWGIARIYSMDQLKHLRQKKYQGTLDYEYNKRIVTKKLNETQRIKLWKEYQMYEEFIKRFSMGLPLSYYEKYPPKFTYKPHKHNCMPWLETEPEPRIMKDKIILDCSPVCSRWQREDSETLSTRSQRSEWSLSIYEEERSDSDSSDNIEKVVMSKSTISQDSSGTEPENQEKKKSMLEIEEVGEVEGQMPYATQLPSSEGAGTTEPVANYV